MIASVRESEHAQRGASISLQTRNKVDSAFLPANSYTSLRDRLRGMADPELPIVAYYAFDMNTRVGPFVGPDKYMPNNGIRSIGGSLHDAGFTNTRVVLGPSNPNFDARYARLNGEIPQILGIGSMQIHEADAHRKINQANSLGDRRPLIVGGGPHGKYQAWDYFNRNPEESADVVVTGDSYVFLSLLETILEHKFRDETMLQGFERARIEGALDGIPGLMYITDDREGLIDTGKDKLVANLDELPLDIVGLQLIEPTHNGRGLSRNPVALNRLKGNGYRVISVQSSVGCNFDCSYCPIPKMVGYTLRLLSPERFAENLKTIVESTGIKNAFGVDDNLFSFKREAMIKRFETTARTEIHGKPFRDSVFFGTEATEHQAHYFMMDLFPLMREGGLRGIWMGIEDMTAELVKKGQTPTKTKELFREMRKNGIAPMPMMMHYDGQPFRSEDGSLDGILNQVKFLEEHGAPSMQVTYLGPSIGSKDYKRLFEEGNILTKVGNMDVDWWLWDGNHVISTEEEDVLGRQDNILNCYRHFYNPRKLIKSSLEYGLELIKSFLWKRTASTDLAEVHAAYQWLGRAGMRISEINIKEWRRNLATRVFEFTDKIPTSSIPVVSV
ncbi:MAG: radical SAM protein [Nanoarchaeota archaeon]